MGLYPAFWTSQWFLFVAGAEPWGGGAVGNEHLGSLFFFRSPYVSTHIKCIKRKRSCTRVSAAVSENACLFGSNQQHHKNHQHKMLRMALKVPCLGCALLRAIVSGTAVRHVECTSNGCGYISGWGPLISVSPSGEFGKAAQELDRAMALQPQSAELAPGHRLPTTTTKPLGGMTRDAVGYLVIPKKPVRLGLFFEFSFSTFREMPHRIDFFMQFVSSEKHTDFVI